MPPKSDIWERLSEVESAAGMTVLVAPEAGWFTVQEYAKQRNVTSTTSSRRLSRLAASGLLETKIIKMRVKETTQTVRVYRLKEKGA